MIATLGFVFPFRRFLEEFSSPHFELLYGLLCLFAFLCFEENLDFGWVYGYPVAALEA